MHNINNNFIGCFSQSVSQSDINLLRRQICLQSLKRTNYLQWNNGQEWFLEKNKCLFSFLRKSVTESELSRYVVGPRLPRGREKINSYFTPS